MPATIVTPKKQRKRTRAPGASAKRKLARAFQTFSYAADSLEKSYGNLQAEVLRLRVEVERTNCDLATSVEENSRIRGQLARVIEGLPCGVVVANRRGQIRVTNPEARRLLRATVPITSHHAPSIEQKPAPLQNYLQESRQCGTPTERDWAIETPEGKRAMGLSSTALGEGKEERTASESVFLLRDITEEKKRAAEGDLVRRKESLAEMATLLAHEIRNALGSLELFAGLLADAAATQPDLRRWTDHIQAGLRSLSATVNNVLQFHSQPPPQLAPVNLGRLMRDSVEFLRPLARQAALRIDLQNFLGELEVPADAHRLQQLFFNLALNAFRAMSTGGVLTVRMQWADLNRMDEVRVHFEDTGRGIAPEHLPKVFEAGFTTHAGNPGLGLAVCRVVAQLHGGEIRVTSEPGVGTTFSLILPRVGALA